MPSSSKKSTHAPTLIKGYAAVRVSLPLRNGDAFLFVKEHRANVNNNNNNHNNSKVLFVANAPHVPRVRTHVFLHALFSRYGEVEQVTVIRNPRGGVTDERSAPFLEQRFNNDHAEQYCCDSERVTDDFGFDRDVYDEGKFAHVTFVSAKELRKAVKAVAVTSNTQGATVVVTDTELSALVQESQEDNGDDESVSAVLALARRRREHAVPRAVLLERCNAAMERFEAAEDATTTTKKTLSAPDEDGFVTVSYGAATAGSKRELEEEPSAFGAATLDDARRGRASKRSRKKKEATGRNDFYRFQTREAKRQGVEELRARFEEDLAAVQKMKERKAYRPFAN